MGVIDNYDLRATLRAIHRDELSADDAKAILDITRRAAAADKKTDIAEMTMLLRIKDLVSQMAGEVALPTTGHFETVNAAVLSESVRALAFACGYLVMSQDRSIAPEERALVTTLGTELALDGDRVTELVGMIDMLVRSAT